MIVIHYELVKRKEYYYFIYFILYERRIYFFDENMNDVDVN